MKIIRTNLNAENFAVSIKEQISWFTNGSVFEPARSTKTVPFIKRQLECLSVSTIEIHERTASLVCLSVIALDQKKTTRK